MIRLLLYLVYLFVRGLKVLCTPFIIPVKPLTRVLINALIVIAEVGICWYAFWYVGVRRELGVFAIVYFFVGLTVNSLFMRGLQYAGMWLSDKISKR